MATGTHAHQGDEHHLILSGRWRMTQGDHTVELVAGDYLAWDPTVPHDVENIGEGEGRMLVIYPRSGRERTATPSAGAKGLKPRRRRPSSERGDDAARTRFASDAARASYSSGRLYRWAETRRITEAGTPPAGSAAGTGNG